MKRNFILMKHFIIFFSALTIYSSCKTAKPAYNPNRRFPPSQLKQDYSLFRNILEESHPSLYWYTSKDSLDYYFNKGYASIQDSMTETQFRYLLMFVIAKINCGHTTVKYSKSYERYIDTTSGRSFPFAMKFWNDTMMVTANMQRRDPVFRRGVILKSINGFNAKHLTDTLFNYITTDGYSMSGKYQSLSTGFTFAGLYKNVIGLTDSFHLVYIDSLGNENERMVPVYDFSKDSLNSRHLMLRQARDSMNRKRREVVFLSPTNLQLDTSLRTAFMTLSTFDRSNHLKKFFRNSFSILKRDHIGNLIVDVRSNGGGDAGISTLLTRYLIDKKFKLADSLYSVNRHSKYDKYIEKSFLYHLLLRFTTRKRADGKFHFTYFERHYFKPKKQNHFNGQLYILIGGNSFSATTLFAGSLKGQKNVTLVGEETGGGYYGNSAWIIPDVTLPNTRLKFRLPRFRMVMDRNREKNGRGIMPDVFAGPDAASIRLGIDFKAEKVRALIESRKSSNQIN